MSGKDPTIETEIKLRLPRGSRETLDRHPALNPPRASAAGKRREITVYFDSVGHDLAHAGVTLRVRRSDERRVQTVKLFGHGEGVAVQRGEWETAVGSDVPDRGALAGTPAASILQQTDGPLHPVCTTEISRTVRLLHLSDGSVAEADHDEGEIRANGTTEPVSELELELREGRAGALYRLALELAEAVPLVLEPSSKAERGAVLAGGAARAACTPPDVEIDPEVSAAEAFRRIVASALGHMLANMGPAERGDVEGIHQIRVAVRRLRAALMLFKPHLHPRTVTRFDDELRRVGRLFGVARDWDVLALETLPSVGDGMDDRGGDRSGPERAWLSLLSQAVEPRRMAAHAEARAELRAPQFSLLLLGLAAWAEDGGCDPALLGDAALLHSIEDLAPALLDRMARKVRNRGRKIERASSPELHQLRKAIKKLRYTTEFLSGLYRRKAVKAFLAPCKELQSLLGEVNDAASTPSLAEVLAEPPRPELAPAIGALARWAENRGTSAHSRVFKAWHWFRATEPFWETANLRRQ